MRLVFGNRKVNSLRLSSCRVSNESVSPEAKDRRYLAGGEGFNAPQELRDILDGHLQAEGVPSERQHLGLLEELTTSARLRGDHSLGRKRWGGGELKRTALPLHRLLEKDMCQP